MNVGWVVETADAGSPPLVSWDESRGFSESIRSIVRVVGGRVVVWAGCSTTGTTITTVITDCVSQYRFYGLQI